MSHTATYLPTYLFIFLDHPSPSALPLQNFQSHNPSWVLSLSNTLFQYHHHYHTHTHILYVVYLPTNSISITIDLHILALYLLHTFSLVTGKIFSTKYTFYLQHIHSMHNIYTLSTSSTFSLEHLLALYQHY